MKVKRILYFCFKICSFSLVIFFFNQPPPPPSFIAGFIKTVPSVYTLLINTIYIHPIVSRKPREPFSGNTRFLKWQVWCNILSDSFFNLHYTGTMFLGNNEKVLAGIREAATKSSFLMARPLSPNPPPPSSLMADGKLEIWKKRLKKSYFFS